MMKLKNETDLCVSETGEGRRFGPINGKLAQQNAAVICSFETTNQMQQS
jgi:hypothetical protein